MTTIPIHIAIDLEPDALIASPGDTGLTCAGNSLKAFQSMRSELEDRTGAPVHFGWYIRMDRNIGAVFGDTAAIAKKYEKELLSARDAGDWIGLHIHVTDPYGANDKWRANYQDKTLVRETIDEALESFKTFYGRPCAATRMGDMWSNQSAIAQLDQAGVKYDLSVERGLRPNHMRSVHPGTSSIGWRPSLIEIPDTVYQPDRVDFRKIGKDNKRPIWLMPLTSYRRTDIFTTDFARKAAVAMLTSGLRKWAPRDVFRAQTKYDPGFLGAKLRATMNELEQPHLCTAIRNYKFPERINQFIDAIANLTTDYQIQFVTPEKYVSMLTPAAQLHSVEEAVAVGAASIAALQHYNS